MKCDGGMSGEGEITRTSPAAYTGFIKMTTPQGAMTINLSGKRVGDCDAGEARTQRDAQVARTERRRFDLADPQHALIAEMIEDDGAHHFFPSSRIHVQTATALGIPITLDASATT